MRQKVDKALRSGLCDQHTPKIMAALLQVAQGKWELIYPGWEQHPGQHGEKRLKITWKHRQLKLKTLTNLAMSPLLGRSASIEIKWGQELITWKYFYLHILLQGKAESIANVSPPLTGILSFLSFCYHSYLSQHAFCPSSY